MSKVNTIARFTLTLLLLAGTSTLVTSNASAVTNQFRGVNWADSRDNFQSSVLYISGITSSDTYDSAFATGNAIVSQFVSKLGSNAVRMPINEATITRFWSTYTGAIDAALSNGMVVLGYWDSAKSNKPPDMNAFWSMWKTITDKYGSNDNVYFEIFNEPNMYSKADLVTLYSDWLSRYPTIPKSRVILDGTGNAQNVSDVGSVSSLSGCLLAVHDYSFFGSDTWTSEAQWVSQFKGEVGNYSDRTVCTEWGGPMSPGSKNGISYGSLDYSKSPTNYFEAYVRGVSSQLRAWKMGSFYWPGLRDGDWYSMTTKSGTGANTALTVSNQSGLQQLQSSWTGTTPGTGGSSAGGSGAGGRTSSGGSNSNGGGTATSGGASSAGGSGGIAGSNLGIGGVATGGRQASGGATIAGSTGGSSTGSSNTPSGGTTLGVAGAMATGGVVSHTGSIAATGGSNASIGSSLASTAGTLTAGTAPLSGGQTNRAGGSSATAAESPGESSAGCGCRITQATDDARSTRALGLLALGMLAFARRQRR